MVFCRVSAGDILQKWTRETFGDILYVHVITDDMLTAANDEFEQELILGIVLARAFAQWVKFSILKKS